MDPELQSANHHGGNFVSDAQICPSDSSIIAYVLNKEVNFSFLEIFKFYFPQNISFKEIEVIKDIFELPNLTNSGLVNMKSEDRKRK